MTEERMEIAPQIELFVWLGVILGTAMLLVVAAAVVSAATADKRSECERWQAELKAKSISPAKYREVGCA